MKSVTDYEADKFAIYLHISYLNENYDPIMFRLIELHAIIRFDRLYSNHPYNS